MGYLLFVYVSVCVLVQRNEKGRKNADKYS